MSINKNENNISSAFHRTEILLSSEQMSKITQANIIIFGIGGVGSFVAEAIARCGIKNITLVDGDVVDITNINRQLIALTSTVGKLKTEVMKERILDINPEANVKTIAKFYTNDNRNDFNLSQYNYIIDAIDMVTSKLILIEEANSHKVPIISAMGAGNKLDPTCLKVSDIYDTSVCPLARVMRRELKKRGITSLKVVYSTENPARLQNSNSCEIGSVSFVPSVAGLIIAGEVIKNL